jgi:hypothetical protein
MKGFILAMGILSFLFGAKAEEKRPVVPLLVDLGTFTCGTTRLGERPRLGDEFSSRFNADGVADLKKSGTELGTKDGVLDYAHIILSSFSGSFSKDGIKLSISTNTTPAEIIGRFGEPYWKEEDDEEIILFYEYSGGRIELQFEFPGKKNLGFVTLCRNGVLSDAAQRKAYGVTKEWPPREKADQVK